MLLFIKNGHIGFTITPVLPSIEESINNYRKNHFDILRLVDSYKIKTGDLELEKFEISFKQHIDSGRYTEDDYFEICHHYFIVKHFTFNSCYLTLQPQFLNYKIEGKSIRPDILIWCPGNENIRLIVECDGFEYHTSKKTFENDRKRDRLLKTKGYDVIRYSGSEIWRNPAAASNDLYEFIKDLF